jgi:hypothetical protein
MPPKQKKEKENNSVSIMKLSNYVEHLHRDYSE